MKGYLLDTNHLSEAIRPGSPLAKRFGSAQRRGYRVGLCIPVLCELESGIQGLSHPEEHRFGLTRVLEHAKIWPIDSATALHYGRLFHVLRGRGRVLSQVDMMVAALAAQMDLTILTADQDFAAVPNLSVENWIER